MKPKVIDEIVKMQDNKYGEYIPSEVPMCDSNCGLWLEACHLATMKTKRKWEQKFTGSQKE